MTNDIAELKEFLRIEVIKDKPFEWYRLYRRYKYGTVSVKYIFWWRVASFMFQHGNLKNKKIASIIQNKIVKEYNTEIDLRAKIGKNLNIHHHQCIIITGACNIGENFNIRHGLTIGIKTLDEYEKKRDKKCIINIGDNVSIGCNCSIIGDNLKIGSNVVIGAASFINKDIPDNCTVYTEKTNTLKMTDK